MVATPFLSKGPSRGLCSFSNKLINDNEDIAKIGLAGLESLEGLAERWANIDSRLALSSQFPYSEFRLATRRLYLVKHDFIIHGSCRINI